MQMISRRQALRSFTAFSAAIALTTLPTFSRGDPTTAPVESPPGDPGFATSPVTLVEVVGNIAFLSGPGGNITLLRGTDGPLIIDSGIPPRGADVVAAAKDANKGTLPHTLINTHWHYDHIGGNAPLAGAGVDSIIAHDNTLSRMSSDQKIAFLGLTFPASDPVARPGTTFADRLTLHRNGETLTLRHVPNAHTDSDIIIHFENANVISTGDLLFNGAFPFIDYDSKGSIDGMIAAGELLLKMSDDKTKFIPGHRALATRDDLIKFHDMLVTVKDRLSKFAAKGATLAEVQSAKPLADMDPTWGSWFFHGANVVHMIYPHLLT